jgi:ubiquitin-conjugating enzyme E2 J1
MATQGFSTKSPTIKRISKLTQPHIHEHQYSRALTVREAAELTSSPSPDYHAAPLDSNLFEWHFTLRGPPGTPYSTGIYHGRITLPTQYPLRPPSFRFLTPSGRFECNREICLSISGFHEETWQPAWGIRTALLALRAHMEGEARGQVGGIESDEGTRRRLAEGSGGFVCGTCGRRNSEIMEEQGRLAKEAEDAEGARREESRVPEELKLVYKDEMKGTAPAAAAAESHFDAPAGTPDIPSPSIPATAPVVAAPPPAPRLAPAQPVRQQPPQAQRPNGHADDVRLDAAIWVISGVLVILISRMLVRMFT